MANKYTKTPSPDKKLLEILYFDKFMSQSEIGEYFSVSQRIVFRWFRDLGIKSRKAYKRNQTGSDNDSWIGDNAGYQALHQRVVSLKGRPKKCEICNTNDPLKTYDWACIGDYKIIDDYKRMCRSCHWKHDKTGNNFPNNNRIPNNSSKNLKNASN